MWYGQNREKKIKKYMTNDNLVFVVFFFLIFLLYSQCEFRVGSDDSINIENINKMGIIQWLYWRSVNWQPKIFSDLFFAMVNGNLIFWSFLSSIITTGTVILVSKIALIGNKSVELKVYVNVLVCCLYFMIYPFTLNSATFWYTGSFAYGWQMPILLIAMYPYILLLYNKEIQYKIGRLLIFLASIICAYTEPTLAILFCFSGIILMVRSIQKRNINKYLIYNFFMLIINGGIFLYYSLKAGRIDKEIHWYPNFPMLTSIDKFFQGINWTNYYYINSINLIMVVFLIVLTVIIYKNSKYNYVIKIFFSLPLIYLLLNIIPFDVLMRSINKNNLKSAGYWNNISSYFWGEKQHNYLFNTMFANPGNIEYSYKALLPSFLGMLFILSIIILLLLAIDEFEDFVMGGLLYLAAMMSGYIMILSPTIFASGVRVFFIGTIFVILIIARLFYRLLKLDININLIRISLAALVLFTVPLYLQLFFIISKMGEIL